MIIIGYEEGLIQVLRMLIFFIECKIEWCTCTCTMSCMSIAVATPQK
jgi:hypothetical protein